MKLKTIFSGIAMLLLLSAVMLAPVTKAPAHARAHDDSARATLLPEQPAAINADFSFKVAALDVRATSLEATALDLKMRGLKRPALASRDLPTIRPRMSAEAKAYIGNTEAFAAGPPNSLSRRETIDSLHPFARARYRQWRC